MEASWKISGIFKANAQEVAKEISSIGEKCTPQDLVKYARDEKSELHKCFEWNDSVAGEKYREIQAKQVLRMLVITKEAEDKEPIQYRLFVNTGDHCGEYKPLSVVVRKQDEYEKLLAMAKRELQAFKKKYSVLAELDGVFMEIDNL